MMNKYWNNVTYREKHKQTMKTSIKILMNTEGEESLMRLTSTGGIKRVK